MFKKILDLWQRWILNVSYSFVDQILLSGVNFFFNVLLVRWLLPNEYGKFAVAFSIFLFVSGFQNALILQPASVIGTAHYQKYLARYLSVVALINGVLTYGLAIILLLIALVMLFCHHYLAFSFLGLGISTPFILFFWLFRQICYIKTRPDLAWRASFLYAALLTGGAFTLKNYCVVSSFNAFMIMAFSSLLSTLFFWRYIDIDRSTTSPKAWPWGIRVCPAKQDKVFQVRRGEAEHQGKQTPTLGVGVIPISLDRIQIHMSQNLILVREILAKHWRYGRWVVGSAFVSWLSTVSYLPLVGFLVGLQQAGAFRAMQNLTLPLERTLSVFTLLLIPWISKNRSLKGEGYVKQRLFILTVINFFIAIIYGGFLVIYGDRLAKLLYGSGFVVSFTWLLPYFAIIAVVSALVEVLAVGLKTLERPDAIFWAEGISTALTLTVGLYLVVVFKLRGAVLGLLISTIMMVLSLLYFLSKHLGRSKPC